VTPGPRPCGSRPSGERPARRRAPLAPRPTPRRVGRRAVQRHLDLQHEPPGARCVRHRPQALRARRAARAASAAVTPPCRKSRQARLVAWAVGRHEVLVPLGNPYAPNGGPRDRSRVHTLGGIGARALSPCIWSPRTAWRGARGPIPGHPVERQRRPPSSRESAGVVMCQKSRAGRQYWSLSDPAEPGVASVKCWRWCSPVPDRPTRLPRGWWDGPLVRGWRPAACWSLAGGT